MKSEKRVRMMGLLRRPPSFVRSAQSDAWHRCDDPSPVLGSRVRTYCGRLLTVTDILTKATPGYTCQSCNEEARYRGEVRQR